MFWNSIPLPILIELMDRECPSFYLTRRSEHDIQISISNLSIHAKVIESAEVAVDVELFVNQQIQAIKTSNRPLTKVE